MTIHHSMIARTDMGLFIQVEYIGEDAASGERYSMGEDPLTETVHETTGDLFRALSGRDKARPWEALGRCTGKEYVDIPGSPCMLCSRTRDEHVGPLIVENIEPGGQSADGRTCKNGALIPHGHHYQPAAVQVGWVFVSRERHEGDPKRTYLREAWVTVKTARDTVVRTPHFAEFGGSSR